jgi:linoleate 10R-lipoxygenase
LDIGSPCRYWQRVGSIEWGVGNQVSAEFNLVYRWHSAISKRDEKWTEELYLELFGKPSHEVSMQELLIDLKQ